jgi:hypothetical protein
VVRGVDRRMGLEDLVWMVWDVGSGSASDKGHMALEIEGILLQVGVGNLFVLVECY